MGWMWIWTLSLWSNLLMREHECEELLLSVTPPPVTDRSRSYLLITFSLFAAPETLKSARRLKVSLLATKRVPGPLPRSPRRQRSSQGLSEPSWRSTVSDLKSLCSPPRMQVCMSSSSSFLFLCCPAWDSHRTTPSWSWATVLPVSVLTF